ncbi:MAG: metallophosphoesterase [Verrucomicrobiales bacterium]|nr:metallophosphoesterase [Verrucomicrobiales bacterium]
MTVRFLHTADWQLGKPFAGIQDPEKRALVRQERLAVLDRIGQAARESGAAFIVVAGDLFDSPSVTQSTVAAACSAIGRMGLPVYAIPGNHDHGGPGSVWEQDFFRRECAVLAPNFHLLLKPEPVELPQAVLLPCPLRRRAESSDPTAWLRGDGVLDALPPDKPRIVVAHGSVQGFGSGGSGEDDDSGGSAGNLLELNRLDQSALDYIALGDWHGVKEISPKASYCGTPEPDRFAKGETNEPGYVLTVEAARGLLPVVTRVSTARLAWRRAVGFFSEDAALDRLRVEISDWLGQRAHQDLLRLELSGSLGIAAAAELAGLLDSWSARLLRLKLLDRTRVAPAPGETEELTRRAGDPLISRVAARLTAMAAGDDEASATARVALRELHTACMEGS